MLLVLVLILILIWLTNMINKHRLGDYISSLGQFVSFCLCFFTVMVESVAVLLTDFANILVDAKVLFIGITCKLLSEVIKGIW